MKKFGADGTCLRCYETSCHCGGEDTQEKTISIDGIKKWGIVCNCCGNASELHSPNSNCLVGFRCWNCGSTDNFDIEIRMFKNFSDSGSQDIGGDEEWESNSLCECRQCNTSGRVCDFRHRSPADSEVESDIGVEDIDTNYTPSGDWRD